MFYVHNKKMIEWYYDNYQLHIAVNSNHINYALL